MTFAVPLKVTFRLFVYDQRPRDRRAHDARRQGGGGLLRRHPADDGQRHVHHQRHRARHRLAAPPEPGRVLHQGGAALLPPKIIPYRGSWVEFEYDQKDVLSVRIDRKRKFHGTVFLRALGLETDEAILRQVYVAGRPDVAGRRPVPAARAAQGAGARAPARPPGPRTPRGLPDLRRHHARPRTHIGKLDTGQAVASRSEPPELERAFFIGDVVDLDTGEVIFEANDLVPEDIEERLDGRDTPRSRCSSPTGS